MKFLRALSPTPFVCLGSRILEKSSWGRLELKLGFHIDLAACKIVWHSILVVGDISHPIIRVDIVYAEEIQAVNAEPYIAEWILLVPAAEYGSCPAIGRRG